jgi:hypothetical protein
MVLFFAQIFLRRRSSLAAHRQNRCPRLQLPTGSWQADGQSIAFARTRWWKSPRLALGSTATDLWPTTGRTALLFRFTAGDKDLSVPPLELLAAPPERPPRYVSVIL